MAAAHRGIGWEYPCLIWVADYLREEVGTDFAAAFRQGGKWGERRALLLLRGLALQGRGACLVERAMDAMATAHGWAEAGENRQGAVMIGVFRDLAPNGSPAIFDGTSRWICAVLGGGMLSMGRFPDKVWEVRHEAV